MFHRGLQDIAFVCAALDQRDERSTSRAARQSNDGSVKRSPFQWWLEGGRVPVEQPNGEICVGQRVDYEQRSLQENYIDSKADIGNGLSERLSLCTGVSVAAFDIEAPAGLAFLFNSQQASISIEPQAVPDDESRHEPGLSAHSTPMWVFYYFLRARWHLESVTHCHTSLTTVGRLSAEEF